MVPFIVFVLLICFESSSVFGRAFDTYCCLPCPFMGPPEPPSYCGGIQLQPRRPSLLIATEELIQEDYDKPDKSKEKKQPDKPDPPTPPPPPKPKDQPEDNDLDKKKKKKNPEPPQPSRRFFTSLFSIPGAVIDTLTSGEVIL